MSDVPKFKTTDEKAFFDCPCFSEKREAIVRVENDISSAVLATAIINAEMYNLCGQRLVMILVKALAESMTHVMPKEREAAERQLHDMLDLELALRPSKD